MAFYSKTHFKNNLTDKDTPRHKTTSAYRLTAHAKEKMQSYHISESKVKQIIRYPERIEVGVVPDTIAAMVPNQGKNDGEIWVLYKPNKDSSRNNQEQLTIITAWRYPGKSSPRESIPESVRWEIANLSRRV